MLLTVFLVVLALCVGVSIAFQGVESTSSRGNHVMRRERGYEAQAILGTYDRSADSSRESQVSNRSVRRCGIAFGNASCSALSAYPCCSLGGFCGNLDMSHCQCKGCVDFRQYVTEAAVSKWHAEIWRNACASETSMQEKVDSLVLVADACPHCVPGELAVPGSKSRNVEISDQVAPIRELDTSKWGRCFMEWPDRGVSQAPAAVWRLDVVSTSSRKVPYVRWPCTVHSDYPYTGVQALTHQVATHWARMMLASQDDFFNVFNALDIGAGVGLTSLRLGLFARGRTIAIEAEPRRYKILKFFASINPELGIEAFNYVVDADATVDNTGKHRESDGQAPVVNLLNFIKRTYDEDFVANIGFVNVNMADRKSVV